MQFQKLYHLDEQPSKSYSILMIKPHLATQHQALPTLLHHASRYLLPSLDLRADRKLQHANQLSPILANKYSNYDEENLPKHYYQSHWRVSLKLYLKCEKLAQHLLQMFRKNLPHGTTTSHQDISP